MRRNHLLRHLLSQCERFRQNLEGVRHVAGDLATLEVIADTVDHLQDTIAHLKRRLRQDEAEPAAGWQERRA